MGEKSDWQEWIDKRSASVRSRYTAFEAMNEHGFGENIPDDSTPTQVPCPFHGADARPSARYYPHDRSSADYIRCYKCKENWDSINLYAKFRGLKWYDSLKDLERRFGIKLPRKPDGEEIQEPKSKDSATYQSESWGDIPRMLDLLERKLARIRDKVPMVDYVKFCRVIDAVSWDYDRDNDAPQAAMSDILMKCHDKMNAVAAQETLDIE